MGLTLVKYNPNLIMKIENFLMNIYILIDRESREKGIMYVD